MSSIRVLIADDNPTITHALRKTIASASPLITAIDIASNGDSALTSARDHHPDIVFLDIRMPGVDGLDVAERLRADRPELRIVILTAFAEFEYAHRAIGYSVDAFLTKPIDHEALRDTTATLVRKISATEHARHIRVVQERELLRIKQEAHQLEFHAVTVSELLRRVGIQLADGRLAIGPTMQPAVLVVYRYAAVSEYPPIAVAVRHLRPALSHVTDALLLVDAEGPVVVLSRLRDVHLLPVLTGWFSGYAMVSEQSDTRQNIVRVAEERAQLNFYTPRRIRHIGAVEEAEILGTDFPFVRLFMMGTDWCRPERLRFACAGAAQSLFRRARERDRLVAMTRATTEEILHAIKTASTVDDLQHAYERAERLCRPDELPNADFDPVVAAAIRWIDARIGDDLSIAECARSVGRSERQLRRTLREELNCTFTTLVARMRVRTAIHLLRSSDTPIAEIATAVGYSGYVYFYQIFRQYAGEAPSFFRTTESLARYPHLDDVIPLRPPPFTE